MVNQEEDIIYYNQVSLIRQEITSDSTDEEIQNLFQFIEILEQSGPVDKVLAKSAKVIQTHCKLILTKDRIKISPRDNSNSKEDLHSEKIDS